jgi:hypothetical protein
VNPISTIAVIVERRKGEPIMLRECNVMNHDAFLLRLEESDKELLEEVSSAEL